MLKNYQPAILKIGARSPEELRSTVLKASSREATMPSGAPLILIRHVLLPMETGFILKYLSVDLVEDIYLQMQEQRLAEHHTSKNGTFVQ